MGRMQGVYVINICEKGGGVGGVCAVSYRHRTRAADREVEKSGVAGGGREKIGNG